MEWSVNESESDSSNGKQRKGITCSICGPEKSKHHNTDACFFNARSNSKFDGKNQRCNQLQSSGAEDAIDTVASDNSGTASIASLQAQLDALRSAASAAPPPPSQNSAGQKGQAAIQEMLVAMSEHWGRRRCSSTSLIDEVRPRRPWCHQLCQ